LENELDQVLKHIRSVDADVRTLTETLSSSGDASVAVDKLREEVRQQGDGLERQKDRHNELANHVDKTLRERRSEAGRDRQELSAISKQIEGVERGIQTYDARIQALEEAMRHDEEQIAGVRLFEQGLERSITELATKVGKTDEAANRIGEEATQLVGRIEKREQEDDRSRERTALLQEQVKRLLERVSKLEDIAELSKEVGELIERASFERDQLSQRLNIIDRIAEEATERVQVIQQAVAVTEQRSQNQAAALTEVATRLQELEEQTGAELRKIVKVTLTQRRRQVEALSQEIRELGKDEPKTES
jgi:chromosome segregation ATPase